jgi:CRP-like cAMP-binding protein
MSLIDVLRSSPHFRDFSEAELAPLEKAMELREYGDGDVLIREGEPGDAFYLITEGQVRVTQAKVDGGSIEVGMMEPGEVFGLVALIDDQPRSATCTAVGRVVAATLPRSAFKLLYRGDTAWAHHFQYMVARQLARDVRTLNEALVQAMLEGTAEDTAASDSLSYDLRLSLES